jgi:hypothetical protein
MKLKAMKKRENILLFFLSMAILSEIFLLNQNFALKKRSSAYHHLESLLSQVQSRLNEITNSSFALIFYL